MDKADLIARTALVTVHQANRAIKRAVVRFNHIQKTDLGCGTVNRIPSLHAAVGTEQARAAQHLQYFGKKKGPDFDLPSYLLPGKNRPLGFLRKVSYNSYRILASIA